MSTPGEFDHFCYTFPRLNNLQRGMFIALSLQWLDGEEKNKSVHAYFDLLRFQGELTELQSTGILPDDWCSLMVAKYGTFDFFKSFVKRIA